MRFNMYNISDTHGYGVCVCMYDFFRWEKKKNHRSCSKRARRILEGEKSSNVVVVVVIANSARKYNKINRAKRANKSEDDRERDRKRAG